MAAPHLLEYIRQNLAADFSKQDIEEKLRASGWAPQDVSDAFMAVEHPENVAQVSDQNMPPSAEAEEDRIKKELEVEAKKRKWRGEAPVITSGSGIAGWLIRKKIVRTEFQANAVLVVAVILVLSLTLWVNWPKGNNTSTAHAPLGSPRASNNSTH